MLTPAPASVGGRHGLLHGRRAIFRGRGCRKRQCHRPFLWCYDLRPPRLFRRCRSLVSLRCSSLSLHIAQFCTSDAPILIHTGTPDPQLVDVTTIKIPILLQSGSEDAMKGFSDKDKINETTEKIKAAGGDITTYIYDGAQSLSGVCSFVLNLACLAA